LKVDLHFLFNLCGHPSKYYFVTKEVCQRYWLLKKKQCSHSELQKYATQQNVHKSKKKLHQAVAKAILTQAVLGLNIVCLTVLRFLRF